MAANTRQLLQNAIDNLNTDADQLLQGVRAANVNILGNQVADCLFALAEAAITFARHSEAALALAENAIDHAQELVEILERHPARPAARPAELAQAAATALRLAQNATALTLNELYNPILVGPVDDSDENLRRECMRAMELLMGRETRWGLAMKFLLREDIGLHGWYNPPEYRLDQVIKTADGKPDNERETYRRANADVLADTHMELAYLCFKRNEMRLCNNHFVQANELYKLDLQSQRVISEGGISKEAKLGIFYSSPINPYHDLTKAFQLFDGAKDRCPHAKYWLGRAYLNGFGVKRDISKGFQLIQEAACLKVRRALFETANLHEEGCEGIRKNLVLATEYYDAVTLRAKDEREWIWDYATSHLDENKEWHETEGSIGTYAGSMFSWEFAGQAFLFGAVATMSVASDGLEFYGILLVLLPAIGIVVACLSIIMSFHTLVQNMTRSGILIPVYKAKLKACESLVGPKVKPHWWKNEVWHARLLWFGEFIAFLLGIAFLVGWVLLLR